MTYEAATVREWTDLVRRARLGRSTKLVAFTLASYADADGTRVFPGLARLSVECELSYNTVQQAMTTLRESGLIRLVRQGTSRGAADEYRLTIGEATADRVEVLNPAQMRLAIERVRGRKQGVRRTAVHPTGLGAPDDSQPVDNSDVHPTTRGAQDDEDPERAPHYTGSSDERAPQLTDTVHPSYLGPTLQDLDTTTTNQSQGNLRSDLAVVVDDRPEQDQKAGEDQPPPVDEDDPPPTQPAVGRARVPQPDRCPHRLAARTRTDGWSTCGACRREALRSPTASFPVITPREPPDGPLAVVIPFQRPA